ncbi:hypothetical protein, partial [Prevotella sp.]
LYQRRLPSGQQPCGKTQQLHIFEYISDVINKAATLPPRTPLSKYRKLLPDKWKQKNIAQE